MYLFSLLSVQNMCLVATYCIMKIYLLTWIEMSDYWFWFKLNAKSTTNAESTFATFQEIKGEIILKANCLVLNSSKKRTKYLSNSALATRTEFFGWFFGRIGNKEICFWDYLTFTNNFGWHKKTFATIFW